MINYVLQDIEVNLKAHQMLNRNIEINNEIKKNIEKIQEKIMVDENIKNHFINLMNNDEITKYLYLCILNLNLSYRDNLELSSNKDYLIYNLIVLNTLKGVNYEKNEKIK